MTMSTVPKKDLQKAPRLSTMCVRPLNRAVFQHMPGLICKFILALTWFLNLNTARERRCRIHPSNAGLRTRSDAPGCVDFSFLLGRPSADIIQPPNGLSRLRLARPTTSTGPSITPTRPMPIARVSMIPGLNLRYVSPWPSS